MARLGESATGAVALGPGDDAAVIDAPDRRVVASTDVHVEGRHFRRDWLTAYDIGRRSAAASLADIAAMGARPTALLVGLVAPGDIAVLWLEELADGLRDEAASCAAHVVGGDLVRGDAVTIAVTALGDLRGQRPVTRAGARTGDQVVAVGRLGWAAAGLRALLAGEPSGVLPDAFRRPQPPYAAGPTAATRGATAMIDVSDGLAADLGHLATASNVQIDLDLAAVRTLGASGVSVEDLLTGGEDHALAFTIAPQVEMPAGWVVIGQVNEGAGVYCDGAPITGGHDHFA